MPVQVNIVPIFSLKIINVFQQQYEVVSNPSADDPSYIINKGILVGISVVFENLSCFGNITTL